MTVEDFYDKACIKFNFTGWRIVNNVIYLENTDGSVSEKQIKDKAQELFQEWQSLQYQRDRVRKYPNTNDLIVALWEKVMEGRSESADALEVKRQEVKTAHPKPE